MSVLSPQAAEVLADPHTPEQLEAAIKAQGDLVQWHHMCGKMPKAREAYAHVKVLVAMRTPETVAALEAARGLT
jgi:proline racemase